MQKYFKNIAKSGIETLEYLGVIGIVAIVDAWIGYEYGSWPIVASRLILITNTNTKTIKKSNRWTTIQWKVKFSNFAGNLPT